jgi:hypothetical protein
VGGIGGNKKPNYQQRYFVPVHRGELLMNIEKLIHDLRARINPQYYDQLGTESYERHQCVMALEYLRQENERQRFDILAMNQSLDLLREENERLRKDADRLEWLLSDFGKHCFSVDHAWDGESDLRVVIDKVRGAK